jgi:hypothetical protein
MNAPTLARAIVIAIVQHGGQSIHSFDTNTGLVAMCGPNSAVACTIPADHYIAVPNNFTFPAAGVIYAKQADGNIVDCDFGWSDSTDISGVQRWYHSNSAMAALYNKDKGPGWDVQLPGHNKFLIIKPSHPVANAPALKFELVVHHK